MANGFDNFQSPLKSLRFQSQLGKEIERMYKEGDNVVRLTLARVVKVNYKYNTVDVVTNIYKDSTAKNPNDNGKFSARLPVAFGGKTPEGNTYGSTTLATVGSLVLVGFIEGQKDQPIVLNIYGDVDNQSKLTRTTFTGADESDEAVQRELWQLFNLYPSMTYTNVDGNGNQEVTFPGKTFLYVTDTDPGNEFVDDSGFDYDLLPSSHYANGDLIEPKSMQAPTVLYVHQGEDNHRTTFFIKPDGTLRIGSRHTNGEGVTFQELKTDGSFSVVQQKGSNNPEEDTDKFSEIGITPEGTIVLASRNNRLEITNDKGVLINGNPLGFIGDGGEVDLSDIIGTLDEFDRRIVDANTSIKIIDGRIEMKADRSTIDEINSVLINQSAQLTLAFDMINSRVTREEYDIDLEAMEAYARELMEGIAAEVDDVLGSLTDLEGYIDGAFKDGIITEAEAQAIEKYINILETEKLDVDMKYNEIYYHQDLPDDRALALATAKGMFDAAHDNLIFVINQAIADRETTKEEVMAVDNAFTEYRNSLGNMSKEFERAVDAISYAMADWGRYSAQEFAKEYADNMKQAIDGEIFDLNTALYDLDEYIDGAFHDGIITEAEAKAIAKYINSLNAEKRDIDGRYEDIFNNSYLEGEPKSDLETAKFDFDLSHGSLIDTINLAIEDGKTTEEESAQVDFWFGDYANKLERLSKAFETAIDAIALAKAREAEYNAERYADGLMSLIDQDIQDIQTRVGDLDEYIDGAFKDGIITEAEALAIAKYLNSLESEKGDLDNRFYETYYNTYLRGASKVELAQAKDAYDLAHDSLIFAINTAIADGKATEAESQEVDMRFAEYNRTLSALSLAFEKAVNFIAEAIGAEVEQRANEYTDALRTWAESEITQLSDAINLRVTEEQYNLDMNNIERVLGDVEEDLGELIQYIDHAFKDGIIDEAEALSIGKYINALRAEKISVDTKYDSLMGMSDLTGSARTGLSSAKAAVDTAHATLISTIEDVIADNVATEAEVEQVNSQFTAYSNALAELTLAFEVAVSTIAQNKANRAQDGAKDYVDGELLPIRNWISEAEIMITPEAIVSTVRESIEYQQDLSDKVTQEDIDREIGKIQDEIADTYYTMEELDAYLDGAFHDGIVSEAEAKAIEKYLNTLRAEKADVDAKYQELYNSPDLKGTPKSALLTAKNSFNTAHTNLINTINTSISDGKVTETEVGNVNTRFTTYNSALSTLSTRMEEAVNAIAQEKSDRAEENAKRHTNDTYGPLESRVTSAEQKITADAITSVVRSHEAYRSDMDSKASHDDVGAAIDGLEIGGRNLLPLSEFGTWGNGYSLSGHVFQIRNQKNAGIRLPDTHREPNTDYVLSFKTKKISGDVTHLSGHSGSMLSPSTRVYLDGVLVRDGASWSDRLAYPNDAEVHEYVIYFRTASSIDGSIYIQPNRAHYDLTYSMDIWDVQLEKGNKATDWTPAPEDVDEAIGELTDRMQEAELKITPDKITSVVRDSTEYRNDLGELVKKDEVMSAIEQTAETIKISASKIDLEGAVTFNSLDPEVAEGVQKGINSGNLVKNPSVTGSHTGWTSGSVTSVNDSFEGQTVRVLRNTATTDTTTYSEWFDVDPSKAYQISMWVRKSAARGRYYIGVHGGTSDSNTIPFIGVRDSDGVITSTGSTNFYFVTSGNNTGWRQIVGYIMPSGTNSTDMKGVGTNVTSNAIFDPRIKRMRIRWLNYENGGTTTYMYVAHPKVVEVDPNAVIKGTIAVGTLDGWRYGNTTYIDGGNIYTGSIKAGHIDVDTLDAISANLGLVTAGVYKATAGTSTTVMEPTGVSSQFTGSGSRTASLTSGGLTLYSSGGSLATEQARFRENEIWARTELRINAGRLALIGSSAQIYFGSSATNYEGRIDYSGNAFRFQRDQYTYYSVNPGGSTGSTTNSMFLHTFWAAGNQILNIGIRDSVHHTHIRNSTVALKLLAGFTEQVQIRNATDSDYRDLRARDVEAMGTVYAGGASLGTTGSYTYLRTPNSNNYIRLTNASGYVGIYTGGSLTHAFRDDGTKLGGSIEIDGERLGLSPIDSPRVLLSDMILDVFLKAGEPYEVILNDKLTKAITDYGVFPSQPVKIEKRRGSFVVTSSVDTTVDFMIFGTRIGEDGVYWVSMEEEAQVS